MNKQVPIPKVVVDAVATTLKCFIAFVILNNIVWATIYFNKPKCSTGNRVQITQSGNRDIRQDIKN